MGNWVLAGSEKELIKEKVKVIKGGIVVLHHENTFYAVDNRCPHMGFPLHMGSLCDGILTCHWHHARFDVCSGGTLDPWADDMPVYELKTENGEVWVNSNSSSEATEREYTARLEKGLEQNLGLVIAKSVTALIKIGADEKKIIETGLKFGVTHRSKGWGPGLTILSAMANVLHKLDEKNKIQALFQALTRVARDCAGEAPHHLAGELKGFRDSPDRLKTWYRNCTEVRDTTGAERVILTAAEQNSDPEYLSALMLSAATDHMYMDAGHTLDFHNKAFESLKYAGPESEKAVLASLTPLFANAVRSEELHSWNSPVDLVTPLNNAFKELETIKPGNKDSFDRQTLLEKILNDDPHDTVAHITSLLKEGVLPAEIAGVTTLAAAKRAVHFHIQNDFSDWITVLHTFSHAHAVHESVRRSPDEKDIIRGIYHTAVTVYLDRFLNVPSSKYPEAAKKWNLNLKEFLQLFNKQQQVNEAAAWTVDYLRQEGDPDELLSTLGEALLREDADFHSYQMYEAVCAEYDRWDEVNNDFSTQAKEYLLLACSRYLAAHAPTARELPRLGTIAWRLYQGEKLFED